MNEELPYKCEYAKSGRAGCKGCKEKILQGTLRLAIMVRSAFHDGKQPNWYHKDCFFKKHQPTSEALIDGFVKLRTEDQKDIESNLGDGTTVVAPQPEGSKGKKRSADAGTSKSLERLINNFGVECAKSGRSTCVGCQQKIIKDEVRIKKISHDSEAGKKFGGQALWHHVDCFAQLRSELGWFESAEKLPGFEALSAENQQNVKTKIPAIKQEVVVPEVKRQKVDSVLEAKIEQENKEYYELRDKLEKLTKKPTSIFISILEHNKQAVPTVNSEILDHVTDVINFGAIKPCTRCNNGNFVFANSSYLCNGNFSGWAKCDNSIKEPERVPCVIPQHIKDEYPDVFTGQFNVHTRTLKDMPVVVNIEIKFEDEVDGPRVQREKPPLHNMDFVIIGRNKRPKDEIKKIIQKMGGTVSSRVHDNVTAIISSEREVEKMTSYEMTQAKQLGIQVVTDDFLDDVQPDNALTLITSQTICDWGTDPRARMPQTDSSKSQSKSMYSKSVPKSQTVKLKNGCVVDPESNLQNIAHVYSERNRKYFAVLCKTDISTDENSFYKMQMLECDSGRQYWVFKSWGRISTTIGSTKLKKHDSMYEARRDFEQTFLEKTGNSFYKDGEFTKHPGKYYIMDIAYEESPKEEEEVMDVVQNDEVVSKLTVSVQDLMKLMFNLKIMKTVMKEFDLDMEKMPLGKLSSKQIKKAMSVLSEISTLIENDSSMGQKIEASNRFYTLIPHDFGVNRPPVIDNSDMIKAKTEMLESLLEMEQAYSLMNVKEESTEATNSLDVHYKQLKTELVPLDKSTEEFELLCGYVNKTHAPTHSNYSLEVDEIFEVRRHGEDIRYKPFKKFPNRQLLWHGSRLTNFVGILSNGLKIAPPEAPATGYMFGKGVYFADVVSKSANYCCTTPSNNTALMMLCEVALGDTWNFKRSNYVTSLPDDKDSVKGMGRTYPNSAEFHHRADGVVIPTGSLITDNHLDTCLLYNEYIVYDVKQINIKYLFKMKFNYNYRGY